MYFGDGPGVESLKTYYEQQSSGTYSVAGTVTNWVKVNFNQARYGRSNGFPCTGNVCSNTWNLVRDAANVWYADQLAAGRSQAEVNAELATFDVWDRFDFDRDGEFNEADGYIDHFQIVHAGGDQADGDPIYGEDAIWSHRWAAFQNTTTGPTLPDSTPNLNGGTQIGSSRHLDPRLHDPAGERRPQRVLPRVRPRHRPARRLQRPLGRRQQQRALDPDGPEPARCRGRGVHRRPRRRPRRLEQAAARVARLRDRGCPQAQRQDDPAQAQAVQEWQGRPGRGRRAAEEGGRHPDWVRRPRGPTSGTAAPPTTSRTP